ncbi:hypothetical protein RvY_02886 [Ramazzottius varieornatus]|uniref:Helitron helicase-like domain-containing protein n=1 Tax=Ramazzottius varieornatus TaxID=947166 RepID=A0A1D1UWE2_RAMVA|nr:hypothetical protein RvY_02886 [Ramazzottius varieornatus]
MSCNPKWPEIMDQLLPGQTAADRPDITVRMFHGKLSQLFELIPKAVKCGKIIYRIHVIEFQKRGLPHAHIAIKTQKEPVTVDEIDQVISGCVPHDNAQLKGIIESLYKHSCRPERCHKKQKNADRYKQPRRPLTNNSYIDDAGYVPYKRLTEQDRLVVTYDPELTYAQTDT